MPQYASTPNLIQRLTRLERLVADLRRRDPARPDELPLFPVGLHTMPYQSYTGFTTMWETVLTPRTATLALGLVAIGDQVSAANSGGEWQVLLNDTTVVASGSVAPTFSFQFAAPVIDLTPYLADAEVKVSIQARRTSGATTGGKWGLGGSIGLAPRYARLI
jgi:hypothetical protein